MEVTPSIIFPNGEVIIRLGAHLDPTKNKWIKIGKESRYKGQTNVECEISDQPIFVQNVGKIHPIFASSGFVFIKKKDYDFPFMRIIIIIEITFRVNIMNCIIYYIVICAK